MKKTFLIFLISVLIFKTGFSQLNQSTKQENQSPSTINNVGQASQNQSTDIGLKPIKIYLGLTTGINNPYGLFGLNTELATKNVGISIGYGLSTWGNKLGVELKYYMMNYKKGPDFRLVYTFNSGSNNFKIDTRDASGNTTGTAVLNLLPISSIGTIIGYDWGLGKRKNNKFHLGVGYSFALTKNIYNQISGNQLSSSEDFSMRLISPGGFTIALGFDFGIF
jgi:hypothetical protein